MGDGSTAGPWLAAAEMSHPEKPRQRGRSRGVESRIRDPYSSHCRRPADRPGVLGRSSRGGNLGAPGIGEADSDLPSASVPDCSRRAIFRRLGTAIRRDVGRAVIHLLLAFNNSRGTLTPVLSSAGGAHVSCPANLLSSPLPAQPQAYCWVLSLLAPHCVPEHVGNLIKLAAC
jgi:hypothetical protein